MKAKMVLTLGYESFVMDAAKAVAIVELLHDAETYKSEWHGAVGDIPAYQSYHVFANTNTQAIRLEVLTAAAYALAKLAGEPTK